MQLHAELIFWIISSGNRESIALLILEYYSKFNFLGHNVLILEVKYKDMRKYNVTVDTVSLLLGQYWSSLEQGAFRETKNNLVKILLRSKAF